jgi:TPR repeat protein
MNLFLQRFTIVILVPLCSACISFYHEPKPDVSVLDKELIQANEGNVTSQRQLADAFGRTKGPAGGLGADAAASQRYLVAAAEHGSSAAQVDLGNWYLWRAPGAGRDIDAAFYWFERAARQNNSSAYFELQSLREAPGKPYFDIVEACKWALLQSPKTHYCSQKKLNDDQIGLARKSADEWLDRYRPKNTTQR